ncbi:MAG: 4-hydroxybenzoate octaprenyltransferase [Pseudomonadota bacterium]
MPRTETKTPDAISNWVDHTPSGFRPYLRLMRADRPIGVWLLFLPCIWGILIARPDGFHASKFWGLFVLFFVGAFVMRSAGCIYNDIVDRDIDAKVSRTATRPLASGQVSLWEAWTLLIALCLLGFVVLLQFPPTAILIGMSSLLLVAAYPFMKRITWWPQAWLGLTFNWGVLVGAATAAGTVPLSAILTYAAAMFWTLGYDTIYAHQDREEDALIGVKSTARRLGAGSGKAVGMFYGATIMLSGVALWLEGASVWLALLIPAAAQLGWQVIKLDIDDGALCLALFKSNIWAGALLCVSAIAA